MSSIMTALEDEVRSIGEAIEHDFREPCDHDPRVIAERDTALDFQTRYNVMVGWLMDWVIGEISLYNNQFHFKTFMKQCDHLGKRFPIHEELHHIDEIRFIFWTRFQTKMKIMLKQERLKSVKRKLI